jgi:carbonic anhydrase/acetyltransferase-like protein (isoleucine patch superfamily)
LPKRPLQLRLRARPGDQRPVIYDLGDRHPVFEGDHFIAHNATIVGSVRLKAHASVWFNSVLRGDNDWIEIGERSNVQDGSVVHTDPGFRMVVGDDVTIGHKVILHGCSIGNNSLIGIGSTLLNGSAIGGNCIVGAHSLVTENKSFPEGTLIMGSPARVVRDLNAEEIALIGRSAEVYVENSKRFREMLAPSGMTD